MFGQTNVKNSLGIDIAVSPDMVDALETWSLMYNNNSPWLTSDLHSLNLAASIASEIARAVTIEMKVKLTGSTRADYLFEQLDPVLDGLRQAVEFGSAKGGLMFKPFVDGDQIIVDQVQADMFYPAAFDSSGNITACIFADQRTINSNYYTRLEYHQMTDTGCMISNYAFRSSVKGALGSPVPLDAVDAWKDIEPVAEIQGIDTPLYAYFRFPQANNIDPTSPLGVSCYSRAVDLIKRADIQWSNLLWEFESGQRALYVDAMAFDKDADDNPILPNKRLYRTLNGMNPINVGDEQFYKEWTPTLREANILSGLDAILRQVEFSCGLAYGTLSNPQNVDKTATELKIAKQRSYVTITDTQKALRTALEQLLYAMDVWATLAKLAPKGKYTAEYDFDDSIITDKDAQLEQDKSTVEMLAMPKYVYLMRNYGLDEETAKKWILDTEQEANNNVPEEWYREPTNQTTESQRATAETVGGTA